MERAQSLLRFQTTITSNETNRGQLCRVSASDGWLMVLLPQLASLRESASLNLVEAAASWQQVTQSKGNRQRVQRERNRKGYFVIEKKLW
jgi:hypothetical protein